MCKCCYNQYQLQYYYNNKGKHKIRSASWRLKNREKLLQKKKEYYQLNKAHINNYVLNKMHSDVNYKLRHNLRTRLNQALRTNYRSGSAVRDLGCTIPEFKQHLESKFQPGMTWDNWGSGCGEWSIDHIIPLSKFDLSNREEFLKACNYTNLQPLWASENSIKGNKQIYEISVGI